MGICKYLYIFSHSRRIFRDAHALQRWKTMISLRFYGGELNGLPVGHMHRGHLSSKSRHGNINAALDLGPGCLLWDSNLPKIAAGFGSCVDATFSKVKSFCDSSGNLKAGALPWYPSQWYSDVERRNPLEFDMDFLQLPSRVCLSRYRVQGFTLLEINGLPIFAPQVPTQSQVLQSYLVNVECKLKFANHCR